jgi:hypothetical protein
MEGFDFGDSDSLVTKPKAKRGRKRKNETEQQTIKKTPVTKRKKKTNNLFEIDFERKISHQIQDWINKV